MEAVAEPSERLNRCRRAVEWQAVVAALSAVAGSLRVVAKKAQNRSTAAMRSFYSPEVREIDRSDAWVTGADPA
ncbi:predicted protein [Streptomyces sp. AA4]|nr:predicted protein [Streptomyces sp. AA4]